MIDDQLNSKFLPALQIANYQSPSIFLKKESIYSCLASPYPWKFLSASLASLVGFISSCQFFQVISSNLPFGYNQIFTKLWRCVFVNNFLSLSIIRMKGSKSYSMLCIYDVLHVSTCTRLFELWFKHVQLTIVVWIN